jgi:hypothetical protein
MLLRALREIGGLCRPDGTVTIGLNTGRHSGAVQVMLATGLLDIDAGAPGADGFITYRLTSKALLLADMRPMRASRARRTDARRMGVPA